MSNLITSILQSDKFKDASEETLIQLILSELLKDVDYLLDMFTFEPGDILFEKSYTHTNYKVPNGLNYDAFMKATPMTIIIENACFSSLMLNSLEDLDMAKDIT